MKLILEIDATYEEDGGYWRNTPPAEIVEKIQNSLNTIQVFIKKGSSETQMVRASISVAKIILEPKDYGGR